MARRKRSRGTQWIESLESRQFLAVDPYFDLAQVTSSSSAGWLADFDGQVIFSASGPLGNEPYITDGTPMGTRLLRDIQVGPSSSSSNNFTAAGQFAYFIADRSGFGRELWRTDGTEAGTIMLADLVPGANFPSITNLTAFGSHLYFFVTHSGARALWRSDGSAAGTSVVWSNIDSLANPELVRFGGRLLFVGYDSVYGGELRAIQPDGTVQLVADLRPGLHFSDPFQLFDAGDWLYFVASTNFRSTLAALPINQGLR